jgi:hypothetical protein
MSLHRADNSPKAETWELAAGGKNTSRGWSWLRPFPRTPLRRASWQPGAIPSPGGTARPNGWYHPKNQQKPYNHPKSKHRGWYHPKNHRKPITINTERNGGWYHAKIEGNGDTIQTTAIDACTTKSRHRPQPLTTLHLLKASRRKLTHSAFAATSMRRRNRTVTKETM